MGVGFFCIYMVFFCFAGRKAVLRMCLMMDLLKYMGNLEHLKLVVFGGSGERE